MERDKEEIRVVVDTNVLISALLKDNSFTGRLLRSDSLDIYYPEDGLREIQEYKSYILSKREKTLQNKVLSIC